MDFPLDSEIIYYCKRCFLAYEPKLGEAHAYTSAVCAIAACARRASSTIVWRIGDEASLLTPPSSSLAAIIDDLLSTRRLTPTTTVAAHCVAV